MSTRLKPSVTRRLLWRACLDGREPAESLTAEQREQLVALLLGRGWSVVDIAEHTFMTTYTTGRIRDRIRLRRLERKRAG